MKAELQRKLEFRAADLRRKASQFRHILPHSAALAETDAKLLLEAAGALGMRDEDLDELARRHVEGAEVRP
ncbi:hypothetical protein ACP4J4_01835 [Aureimonas ureilytica]|uniref:hypothetical protein n=1 Tax=Aureimonas ureilytica TaxID=401562 RepID=UPI003CE90C4F